MSDLRTFEQFLADEVSEAKSMSRDANPVIRIIAQADCWERHVADVTRLRAASGGDKKAIRIKYQTIVYAALDEIDAALVRSARGGSGTRAESLPNAIAALAAEVAELTHERDAANASVQPEIEEKLRHMREADELRNVRIPALRARVAELEGGLRKVYDMGHDDDPEVWGLVLDLLAAVKEGEKP